MKIFNKSKKGPINWAVIINSEKEFIEKFGQGKGESERIRELRKKKLDRILK